MRIRFCYFLPLFCLLLTNCREKEVAAVDPRTITDTLKISFTDSLRVKTSLLPESDTIAKQSEGYNTLARATGTLDHSSIGDVKTEIDAWVEAALQLREKFKGTSTNKAINARMIVLNTKANILRQELDKRVVDTAVINQEATEFYNAFQDFGLQLNLMFGKSVDDLLNDFKKESQKRRTEAQKEQAKRNNTDTVNNP